MTSILRNDVIITSWNFLEKMLTSAGFYVITSVIGPKNYFEKEEARIMNILGKFQVILMSGSGIMAI